MGIGITDFLIKLLSCLGFLKNINYVVILKGSKSMVEYYLSKGFTIVEWNDNNLAKLPNELKQIIHVEETHNSDEVMKYINTIPYTSNTPKNLVVNEKSHPSYFQREFNDKKKIIINIFSAYVVPLLKNINHLVLLQ